MRDASRPGDSHEGGRGSRFALACAGMVLDKFESKYPDDDRPRKAMEAAKAWLDNPTEANRSAVGQQQQVSSMVSSTVSSSQQVSSRVSSSQQHGQQHGQHSQQHGQQQSAAQSASAGSAVWSAAESAAWSAAVARQRKELARIIAEAIPA